VVAMSPRSPAKRPRARVWRATWAVRSATPATKDVATSMGPSWAGLAGSQVTLEDGSKVTADRAYLERAIKEPSAEVVDGFKPIMPTVPLDDTQMDQVIAYIEALGNN
jgi:cytochrome c1